MMGPPAPIFFVGHPGAPRAGRAGATHPAAILPPLDPARQFVSFLPAPFFYLVPDHFLS